MREHLARWVAADGKIANLKQEMADLEQEVVKWQTEADDARCQLAAEMKSNGVLEELVDGELIDYKLSFTNPRGAIKCPDADAVPDEFCKIERKPELKKVKEYLDAGNEVNWATIEFSEPKLTYRLVKRK